MMAQWPKKDCSTRRYQKSMDVYLIDGTYELFRHFFDLPSASDGDGQEIAVVRGVPTKLALLRSLASHRNRFPPFWP